MPAISKELKDQLIREGRWVDFVKCRDAFRKEDGLAPAEAHRRAIHEFFDNPPAKITEDRRKRPKADDTLPSSLVESESLADPFPPPSNNKRRAKKAKKAEKAVKPDPAAKDSVKDSSGHGPPTASGSGGETRVKPPMGLLRPLPVVTSADFNGRQTSEVEAVRWVAENMEIDNPDPRECPGRAAWGLLVQCRGTMTAKQEFWKLTFPKLLPSRAQMEEMGKDKARDLGKASEVIDKLLSFGKDIEPVPGGEVADDNKDVDGKQ